MRTYDDGVAEMSPGGWFRVETYSTSTLRKWLRDWKATARKNPRTKGNIAGLEAELQRRKDSGEDKLNRRVTARQEGGDDGYHWVVRVDGRMVMNGLTKREADYEKKRQRDQLMSR